MGTTNFDKLDIDELNVAGVDVSAGVAAETGTYTVTAPAAIPAAIQYIELNHATGPVVKTIATLVDHAGLLVIKDISATGTAAHTVTATVGTFNGTNNVATLDALNECLVCWIDSAGNGTVLVNSGSVGLS